MATLTFRLQINPNTYTLVGDGVSELSCIEQSVNRVRVVVVDEGDPQPAPNETQYVSFDDFYQRNGRSADVYMLVEGVDVTFVEGERA